MKARHPSSRDCFDYSIKIELVRNIVAKMNFISSIREEGRRTTSNELITNLLGMNARGCCVGVENDKTKQKQ
jgi:hypothetical protein